MVRRRRKEVPNQRENIVRKNQMETGKPSNTSIPPPRVMRISSKSRVENLLMLDPLRFSNVNTRYDISKKIVNSFVIIPNSIFQYNSAKNNTSPN
jgi:hypothetical protein